MDDPKVAAICNTLAQVMQDMAAHGYSKIEAPWEVRCVDGSKVIDWGVVYVSRDADGGFAVRITDRYTGDQVAR